MLSWRNAATNTTGTSATAADGETIHTTANHPWLTADRGWVQASQLQPGEPVITLNGGTSTVAWVRVVPGAANRYNLTVAQDHTYAVGAGLWVVHNVGCGSEGLQGMKAKVRAAQSDYIRSGNTYTAGGVVIRDSQTGDELFQAGPFEGTNNVRPIGVSHAETQSLNAANDWLTEQGSNGGSGDITVDIITARKPCDDWCEPNMTNGTWLGNLQMSGQANYTIRLRIWRLWDDGRFKPVLEAK